MKIVYLVTQGEYSDYRICAAYSTRERAQKYVIEWEKLGITYDRPSIEELEINKTVPKVVTVVYMDKEGRTYNLRLDLSNHYPIGFVGFMATVRNHPEKSQLIWNVHTKDEKRAVKIVNEKRSQLIALNLWGNTEGAKRFYGSIV